VHLTSRSSFFGSRAGAVTRQLAAGVLQVRQVYIEFRLRNPLQNQREAHAICSVLYQYPQWYTRSGSALWALST
jgi:hypothetical protein